jgi:iron complex transport system ATP-binding protein
VANPFFSDGGFVIMKPTYALTAQKLTVHRGSLCVLGEVDLSIHAAQWTCVVGPNGAGKTTLLKAMAGLLPSSGELRVQEQDLRTLAAKDRAKMIAWLGQQEQGSDDLSVNDVVMLGRLPHQSSWVGADAKDTAQVQTWLTLLQLTHLKDISLAQLSAGERQRALLGRALAVQAPILLMDEPIANVDLPNQSDWLQTVQQLTQQNTTVVSVLHDLNLAMRADHVVLMHQGRLVIHAKPDDPQLHQALMQVFAQRITIHRVADQWVVLPL